jgi:formate hydrogenlyase transcriptional activator
VTEHELLTQELRRREAYLAEAQRLSRTGSFGWRPDSGEIVWSAETYRIFGYDEGITPTLDSVVRRVHPEDRAEFQRVVDAASGSAASQFEQTYRLLLPGESVKHVHALARRIADAFERHEFVGAVTDITEHKLAEEALRQSEENFRLVVDGIAGLVSALTPGGDVDFVNSQVLEYFGKTFDELKNWQTSDAVHPDDHDRVVTLWANTIANGQPYDVEYRLRRSDGMYRWFHARGRPLRDAEGAIARWYVLLTDIDERKQAEQRMKEQEEERKRVDEQLRRSEGFLLEAQRLSHTGSWRHHLSTGAVTTSPEMLRMWGVRPEEDSSAIEFWFDRIHPDDRLRVQGAFADSEREKRDYEADYRILLPDGAVRYHHSVGHAVVNESGDLSEFVGTAMDVTELWQITAELEKANRALREREAALLEAQRMTHAGSWRHDVWLGTVTVTPEVHRIFATSPDEDASTADFFFNRIHPDDRAAELDNYAKAQETKRDFQSDYRIVLPDESVRHIHNIGHPVLNESDEITAFVGTMTDVTEQVEARTELEQASAALRSSEQQLRLTVDSIPGLICVMTATGEVDVVNQTFLDYAGKTPEEFDTWQVVVHLEDLQFVQRELERSLEAESPVDLEVRLRRSDGMYRWFHARGRPLRDAEGAIARWYVLLTDIDERKQAEQRRKEQEAELRQILDLNPQLVGVLGPARERLYLNHTALEYLGVSLDEWRQRAPGLSIHPEDVDRLYAYADRASSTGSTDEVEARVRKHDGSYRWFHVRFNPVRDDQGQITRWYWACTDIDDRKRAQERLEQENVALREEIDKTSMFEEIVGASSALKALLSRVSKVAGSDSTVLINGETGTGKELVARAIHRRSPRGARPFVSVNCAAVPRELIASELFGHEKGAFTGATQRRLGRFELAHGGTIFLDEVGELPMETQVALLRVLQEREFERVGGSAAIRVDVRVIAATNRDLQAAIDAGTFRSDLFYRLNVFPITVPPLRERADDIPLLVEYFIDRYARMVGKTIRHVNKRALDRLQSYPWPGNVRELQNVIERSVIVCDTEEFTVDDSWLSAGPAVESRLALSSTVAAHEKATIEEALRASGGRVFGPSGAAARLGIARSTLESKIRALGIDKNRFRGRPAKP